MKYEQCTFLQDTGADFSQTSSSGTVQLSLLSGMPMPAKSSENEPQTDGFQACECGKGTSDCLTHPSTPEAWTAFMRDSLALILALPENKQALALKQEVASTVKPSASLASFDPASCTWKTLQTSLLTDLELYSQTLPRSGMTRSGFVYELPIVGRLTKEIDGGYLPTPNAMLGTSNLALNCSGDGREKPNKLGWAIGELMGLSSGFLNPQWVEWFMGWPINHTALKELGTGKYRSKPQQHGNSSEVNK